LGIEPENRGVQSAKDRAGSQGGVGRDEFFGANTGSNYLTETLFVAVALCEQTLLQIMRDGVGHQMGGGAFYFIKNTMEMKRDY
jgi:preprotein translocase subunit SecG